MEEEIRVPSTKLFGVWTGKLPPSPKVIQTLFTAIENDSGNNIDGNNNRNGCWQALPCFILSTTLSSRIQPSLFYRKLRFSKMKWLM
jgi:hypothetical protein